MNRERPIDVLYEDGQYFAFNKPSGLLIIPTPKKEKKTLVDLVNVQYKTNEAGPKLYPCHRLDRDTSGVVLFAQGKQNQKRLTEAFKNRKVKKVYTAFVHGKLPRKQGEIKSVIRDLDQRKFQRRAPGKLAITKYKVLAQKKKYCVVEVSPITGRTNQIRIHFKQLGHPIVGERKYAFARDYPLKFKRVALHASSLAWTHPKTKKQISVQSPLPNDMEVFLARNRN